MTRFNEQRVLGVLITPVDDALDERIARLIDRGTPVVLVDRGSSYSDRCSVTVDEPHRHRCPRWGTGRPPPCRDVELDQPFTAAVDRPLGG